MVIPWKLILELAGLVLCIISIVIVAIAAFKSIPKLSKRYNYIETAINAQIQADEANAASGSSTESE